MNETFIKIAPVSCSVPKWLLMSIRCANEKREASFIFLASHLELESTFAPTINRKPCGKFAGAGHWLATSRAARRLRIHRGTIAVATPASEAHPSRARSSALIIALGEVCSLHRNHASGHSEGATGCQVAWGSRRGRRVSNGGGNIPRQSVGAVLWRLRHSVGAIHLATLLHHLMIYPHETVVNLQLSQVHIDHRRNG